MFTVAGNFIGTGLDADQTSEIGCVSIRMRGIFTTIAIVVDTSELNAFILQFLDQGLAAIHDHTMASYGLAVREFGASLEIRATCTSAAIEIPLHEFYPYLRYLLALVPDLASVYIHTP
jgi:hypothetical protein